MASQRHPVISAKDAIKTSSLKPDNGEVLVLKNSDSKTMLAEGELLFFNALSKKEQAYVIESPISYLQRQLKKMFNDEEKNIANFSLILTANEEAHVIYPQTCILIMCVLQGNGTIKISYPSNSTSNSWLGLNIASLTINKGLDETFLVLMEANTTKDAKLIEDKIIKTLRASQDGEIIDLFYKKLIAMSPPMLMTKVTAKSDMAKWMIIFESEDDQKKCEGLSNLYGDLLNRYTRFVLECRQIVEHIKNFLHCFWNLTTFQTASQGDSVNFIKSLGVRKIKVGEDKYNVSSGIVKIFKCLENQKNLNSSFEILHKIREIASKEMPGICKSLQLAQLTMDELAKIKEPHKCFYTTLYLSLGAVGEFDFNFEMFNERFFNPEMQSFFNMEKQGTTYMGLEKLRNTGMEKRRNLT